MSQIDSKNKSLQEAVHQHTNILNQLNEVLTKINRKQAELDTIQQNRHLEGEEYDDSGNIIITDAERNCASEIKVRLLIIS